MGTSSLIYAVIVGLWAAYLIPKLTRREALVDDDAPAEAPTGERSPRVVRAAHRPTPLPGDHARVAVAEPRPAPSPRAAVRRRLARRRRRVLVLLLALPALAGAAAAAGLLAWPAALGPLVLPALYLRQVRRATVAARTRRPAARRPAPPVEPRGVAEHHDGAHHHGDNDQPAEPRQAAEAAEAAVEVDTPTSPGEPVPQDTDSEARAPSRRPLPGGVEWEPMPITLPTYVTKPKAMRTSSRCIDVSAGGGSWTHVEGFVVRHSPVAATIDLDSAELAGATAGVGADGAGDSPERATEGGGGHRRAAGE